MAATAATIQAVYDFQRLRSQTHTIGADEYEVYTCKVDCTFPTTAYAQADDTTITAASAIQNARRDGQTVTVLCGAFVAPGRFTLSAAPTTDVLVGAGAADASASVITVPLTAEDLTTEMTNATALNTSTWSIPLTFQVTFAVKVTGE